MACRFPWAALSHVRGTHDRDGGAGRHGNAVDISSWLQRSRDGKCQVTESPGRQVTLQKNGQGDTEVHPMAFSSFPNGRQRAQGWLRALAQNSWVKNLELTELLSCNLLD